MSQQVLDISSAFETLDVLAVTAMTFPEDLESSNPDAPLEVTMLSYMVETLGELIAASREVQQRTSSHEVTPNPRFAKTTLRELEAQRQDKFRHIHALVEYFQGQTREGN
jgi:hypothetical protein